MKIRHILTAAALAAPLAMGAVPAYPGIQTMVNPDGTTVDLRQYGDRHFNYWTDAEGTRLMERDGKGRWVQVRRNGRDLTTSEADLNLLRSETVPMDRPLMTMASVDSQGRTNYPTIGDPHALVVLVQFKDVKFTVPDVRNAIDKMLNEEGYSDYNSNGSAVDYYKACSNGKFTPKFDVCDVVTLPEDLNYYGERGTYGNGYSYNDFYWSKGLRYALLEVKEKQGVDFSKYDYDNDGKIDNIFFFYAGYGEADGTRRDPEHSLIWPHQGDYTQCGVLYDDWEPVVLDGKTFATYACGNELPGELPPDESYPYLTGIGTFCHEYGHVLGLPDLYDTTGRSTKTPGKYDLMDSGSYNGGYRDIMMTQPPLLSGYERWCLKWVDSDMLPAYLYEDDDKLYEGKDVVLPSNSIDDINIEYVRLKRPYGNSYWSEFYFFETRTPDGWDATLPQHGMLIWHIKFDRSKWTNNYVNTDGDPHVELIGYSSRDMAWGLDGQVSYVYPEAENAIKPANQTPEGWGLYLSDIKYDEEKKQTTFGYNKYAVRSEEAPVLSTPSRSESGRTLYLNWDAVPGATSYCVTIYRIDGSGNRKIIDSKNESDVGNVTSIEVNGISKAAWDMELHAYVRAVVGVPCNAISNEQVFVPSELLTQTGVAGIEGEDADFYAIGLAGRIEASAGSEVYNLNGTRVGTENLPAGVYVVRNNGKSAKVYVK
ncbi:MAG: M6 family metalloprotease domain-containing protein [Bacteroidales bacterium]|nr:M6 family metalloprotease domain-containing protein [Bacteroidales bacterium]